MGQPRTSLGYTSVLWIRNRMFLGLLDTDPDPSIIENIVRKTLMPTVLWLLYYFLAKKNYVNVPSKSKRQKHFLTKFLVDVLKVKDENSRIRSQIQSRIHWIKARIRTKMSRIHNTGIHAPGVIGQLRLWTQQFDGEGFKSNDCKKAWSSFIILVSWLEMWGGFPPLEFMGLETQGK